VHQGFGEEFFRAVEREELERELGGLEEVAEGHRAAEPRQVVARHLDPSSEVRLRREGGQRVGDLEVHFLALRLGNQVRGQRDPGKVGDRDLPVGDLDESDPRRGEQRVRELREAEPSHPGEHHLPDAAPQQGHVAGDPLTEHGEVVEHRLQAMRLAGVPQRL